jgi:hypothetical protein
MKRASLPLRPNLLRCMSPIFGPNHSPTQLPAHRPEEHRGQVGVLGILLVLDQSNSELHIRWKPRPETLLLFAPNWSGRRGRRIKLLFGRGRNIPVSPSAT